MNNIIKYTDREIIVNGCGQRLYDAVAGRVQHTLIFDPPWDIAGRFSMTRSENILAFCDGATAGGVVSLFGAPAWIFTWDCVSSWWTRNRPLRRAKYCLWYGDVSKYTQDGYLYGERSDRPRIVTNTRGTYLFEPKHGKTLSDVFSHPITKLHSADGAHKHSKPQDWITALIANTLRPGDAIIDPFAGGGSSLRAARAIGARWIGAEIDDASCSALDGDNVIRAPSPARHQLDLLEDF